jgi:hypothetical protein
MYVNLLWDGGWSMNYRYAPHHACNHALHTCVYTSTPMAWCKVEDAWTINTHYIMTYEYAAHHAFNHVPHTCVHTSTSATRRETADGAWTIHTQYIMHLIMHHTHVYKPVFLRQGARRRMVPYLSGRASVAAVEAQEGRQSTWWLETGCWEAHCPLWNCELLYLPMYFVYTCVCVCVCFGKLIAHCETVS